MKKLLSVLVVALLFVGDQEIRAETINACVNRFSGRTTILEPFSKKTQCRFWENLVTWSQNGNGGEQPTRKIQYATGLGDPDSRDEGLVNGRILDFIKTQNDTAIRISYTDNFRVIGELPLGKGCSWEIQVDGDSCPSGKLVYNYFATLTDSNQLRSHTVVGYCEGLSVGMHQVTVFVTPLRVDSDCFTGFGFEPEPSRWVIEVEEVN